MRHVGKIIATALLTSSFLATPVVVPKANAQNLFERLFPKAAQRQKERRRYLRERRKKFGINRDRNRKQLRATARKPRTGINPAERIESAKYYTYKATPLRRVKFENLAAGLAKTAPVVNPLIGTYDEIEYPDALTSNYIVSPDPQIRLFSLRDNTDALAKVSLVAEKQIVSILSKHYAKNPRLLWVTQDGQPNDKALAMLDYMKRADAEGLNPADYALKTEDDAVLAGYSQDERTAKAFSFEMNMSARALRYIADAKHGRINPNKISGYHDFPKNKPNYTLYFNSLTASENPVDYLRASHPYDPSYRILRRELEDLRAVEETAEADRIPTKILIKPGFVSPELPKVIAAIEKKASPNLLEKHAETLASYQGSEEYAKPLVKLVIDFQKEKKLGPDGIIGKNTVRKLQGISQKSRIKRVKYAMERLRWHPSNLGKSHIFINQPAYRVTYVKNGKSALSMRAVVGKPKHQTNFFHDKVETVVFNPYWNVPRSILVNEYLPKLRRDPAYLDKRGYEVHRGGQRTYKSASIDWWDPQASKKYLIRQKPGNSNALGELKILFPNRHAIYMHDTPAKALFNHNRRAYSHGCVRLHDPRAMAGMVLGISKKQVGAEINKSPRERAVNVKNQVPVYVAYFTAWPNYTTNKVEYFSDMYSRDEALDKAFKAVNNARAVGHIKFASADTKLSQ